MNEEQLLSIVVEALLYVADPAFSLKEDKNVEDSVITVLAALKASNPDIFDKIKLENIELFYDENEEEAPLISNILRLLGDKINIVKILE